MHACTLIYNHDSFSIQSNLFFSAGPEMETDGAGVMVKTKTIWKGREILKVYFMNPEVLVSWHIGVTPQQMLDWANEAWSKDPNSKVPKFEQCDSIRRGDIRVKFAGKPSIFM